MPEPNRPSSQNNRPRVAIVGAGLAGIATSVALAEYGFPVQLFEARSHLGGRAGSYQDQQSQETIDNCQHVSMGCCTNLRKLCESLGIASQFHVEKTLHFVDRSGRVTKFAADSLPAPFHLTRAFAKLPYLSWRDKLSFARCVGRLAKAKRTDLAGQSFAKWLRKNGQSETLIRRVWEVVLVSALSESLDRIDAVYARKVFVDGFLRNATGWQVEIPTSSLEAIYSDQTNDALTKKGVEVIRNARVESLDGADRIDSITLRSEEKSFADEFVLAVPQHQVSRLLPENARDNSIIEQIEKIESAPITSVHLWFDQEICDLPHAVFVEHLSQWMFRRQDQNSRDDCESHRFQIVISASRNLKRMSQQELIDEVISDIQSVWSKVEDATLLHSRIITEKRAVFSVTPGIEELRPQQQSPIENLQLAGDWTQTGWPATMEGAVRSGYLAARNILTRYGIHDNVLADDLSTSWLSKMIFRLDQADS